MNSTKHTDHQIPVKEYDPEIQAIAAYVVSDQTFSPFAKDTAYHAFMDSLACAFMATSYPDCRAYLGPFLEGGNVPPGQGVRVPATSFIQDPVKAAWDTGCLIRWLDFNDTWLAAEWGHPSDNLGAILAVCDYLSRSQSLLLLVDDVLDAMIKAYEIQGVMALKNSFNQVGICHTILVELASTAIATKLLGGNEAQICAAISHVFADRGSLRVYRHAPNTNERKSWAAADACMRAVQLAWMAKRGLTGIPTVLSAKNWGFYDVCFKGNHFVFSQEYDHYVMENILFKISYPAEFHGQTACEAAITLHKQYKNRLKDIKRIEIFTQAPAVQIISKTGKLNNYADRDHCLEYMVAVCLLFGEINAQSYQDAFYRAHKEIDIFRDKIHVRENLSYTKDYYDPSKRAIGNAIRLEFMRGDFSDLVEVLYPIGHRFRREEGIPLIKDKLEKSLGCFSSSGKSGEVFERLLDYEGLRRMEVCEFMDLISC